MKTEGVIQHTTARERRRHRRPKLALNLTSMIDVTFLLLVYFMVATEFKLGEEVYKLDLPDRQAAQREIDPFELDEEPLQVRAQLEDATAVDADALEAAVAVEKAVIEDRDHRPVLIDQ